MGFPSSSSSPAPWHRLVCGGEGEQLRQLGTNDKLLYPTPNTLLRWLTFWVAERYHLRENLVFLSRRALQPGRVIHEAVPPSKRTKNIRFCSTFVVSDANPWPTGLKSTSRGRIAPVSALSWPQGQCASSAGHQVETSLLAVDAFFAPPPAPRHRCCLVDLSASPK